MEDFRVYDKIQKELRQFFSYEKRFVEVPTQSRFFILAACEDPNTLVVAEIGGVKWSLPQTGQMWLEHELLKNPGLPGVFCVTTSYRNEPHPIKGRHDIVFPMFEFESKGDFRDLENLERELLDFLGFESPTKIFYEDACREYGVNLIGADEEEKLCEKHGTVILYNFPQRTDPFWNMKHNGGGFFNKIDVLLGKEKGMETIGSAERSCNAKEMYQNFMSVSDGKYKQKLFDEFGEERVMGELNEYLSLRMFPRFGGGMGLTRLARAMKSEGLLS